MHKPITNKISRLLAASKCNALRIYKRVYLMGEFVYAVTAAEDIILSSLFIERKQR